MTECRIYTGTLQSQGYGSFRGKLAAELGTTLVHRQTWILANGPIPAGMLVLHRCDNPACYRLDHLFLGTQADNMADMRTKDRGHRFADVQTHCKNGHEFTAENTYWHGRKGYDYRFRECRTCGRARQRAYQQRRG